MKDVSYIAEHSELAKMCDLLRDCDWLAVDTEFVREKTYYPQLALIQLASETSVFCVDPQTIEDLSALFALLEQNSIVKVFHAAGQDLEIFYHRRQRLPQPIFDTQVAASLLGLGEQLGYASLVNKLLKVQLDKSHSRTDWQQRPLQDEQIRYAADDVRYLSRLYPLMRNKLEKLGRLDWIESEHRHLLDPATYQPDPANCWKRIKGHGKLRSRQLNALKHLAAWREQLAIRQDRPRRWILPDDTLLDLAVQRPTDHEQLQRIRSLDTRKIERHAEEWFGLIELAAAEDPDQWPKVQRPRKPGADEEAAMDMMMAVVRMQADKHQLSPGQITSRSELLRLLRGERELPILNGWRFKIAGQAVIDTCAGKIQLVCEQGRPALKSN